MLKKDELLGMPWNTANTRLRKKLIWYLIIKLGFNQCYKCQDNIEDSEELFIDHINDWQLAENPIESFFNMENISFRHLHCSKILKTALEKRIHKQNEKQKKYTAGVRKKYFDENGPCALCGSTKQLELDHIDPSLKTGTSIWSWGDKKREKELENCQILCHVCHAEKTARERTARRLPCGTNASYGRGCRCTLCAEARNAYKRDTYKRKKKREKELLKV